MMKTLEQFKLDSQKLYGNKFDYSNAIYLGNKIKLELTCNDCGTIIYISPNSHLSKHSSGGCKTCQYKNISDDLKITFTKFLTRAIDKHLNNFIYYSETYKNYTTKMIMYCKKCNNFIKNSPEFHIESKSGCYLCSPIKTKSNYEFIEEMKFKYGEAFNFSKVNYINNKIKIIIICNKCGYEFLIKPNRLITEKIGCKNCRNTIVDLESFLKKASEVHADSYDYSKVRFVKSSESVLIICNKCKFEFYKKPYKHVYGKQGCPKCSVMSKGEIFIDIILKQYGVNFKARKSIPGCVYVGNLIFDFIIYDENNNIIAALEYQGLQHYTPVRFGGISIERAEENFKNNNIRDSIKQKFCVDNNIPLLYIKYNESYEEIESNIIKFLRPLCKFYY